MSTSALPHRTPPAGPVQRLLAPVIEPGLFDFWVQHLNPAWSWSRPLARVVAHRVEAADTVTLTLRPNRHCASVLPGQHINVSAAVNGRRLTRSYSVSNVPTRGGPIEITIKRVEGGRLSTHLCRDVQVGDALALGDAFGDMTLPAQPEGRWLFLAAGSGITPLISLTRWLATKGMPVPLDLVYWARTRADLCFVAELQQLAAQHPHFRFQPVVTHEAPQAGEASGLLTLPQVQGFCPDLAQRQVLACGPGGFVEAARTLLQGQVQRFQAEGFTPVAPPAVSPIDGNPSDAPQVQVQLRQSGRTLAVSSGTSLLEALEKAGMNPASGCRMGVCHTCVCTKHEGTVQDTGTRDLHTEPDGRIRLCVSRALTDVSLDL